MFSIIIDSFYIEKKKNKKWFNKIVIIIKIISNYYKNTLILQEFILFSK